MVGKGDAVSGGSNLSPPLPPPVNQAPSKQDLSFLSSPLSLRTLKLKTKQQELLIRVTILCLVYILAFITCCLFYVVRNRRTEEDREGRTTVLLSERPCCYCIKPYWDCTITQCFSDLWEKRMLVVAADPNLMHKFDQGDMERMLMVGLICVHPNYQQRPTMKEAAWMLRGDAAPRIAYSEADGFDSNLETIPVAANDQISNQNRRNQAQLLKWL